MRTKLKVFHSSRRHRSVKMSKPAQLTSLIHQRVQEAVTNAQKDMDQIITTSFNTFQKTMNENQRQLSETQLAKIEEMNSDNYVFKRKGNEEQFKINAKVGNEIKEARCFLKEDPEPSEYTQKAVKSIGEGLKILNHRQKLVKLADQSENGWKTVTEYETHSLADDSEDEKRILRAEKAKSDKKNRQSRNTPYSTSRTTNRFISPITPNVPVQCPGKCYECGMSGHWRIDHQTGAFGALTQKNKIDKISKPVNILDLSDNCFKEVDLVEQVLNDRHTNEVCSNDSPVGRLRYVYEYWQSIHAYDHILSAIRDGYKLPFYSEPNNCILRNNRSALDNSEFVESEIQKLSRLGCIREVYTLPKVINPLTVAKNKDKCRLVLDCRHINPHLHKFRFKYEDSVEASNQFKRGDFLFAYDLPSAYHHIEIFSRSHDISRFQLAFQERKCN